MTRLGYSFAAGAALLSLALAGEAGAQTAPKPVPAPRVYIGAMPDIAIPDVAALPDLDLSALDGVNVNVDVKYAALERLGALKALQAMPALDLLSPKIEAAMDVARRVNIDAQDFKWAARDDAQDRARDAQESQRDAQREASDRQREAADRQREASDRLREAQRDAQRQVERGKRFARCEEQNDADRLYDCGREALDDSQWDRAAVLFAKTAQAKSDRADAALYWRAYAQNKLGQRAEALNTLGELKTGYAKSRWANDATALEGEIRQNAGQRLSPEAGVDDDLKAMALQAVGTGPEAVPVLEKVLLGTQSPKLKDKALFMLAQNNNAAARALVAKIAKGGANPELQFKAVRYLGTFRSPESRQTLDEVYRATTDGDVKKAILRSYMVSGDKERLLAAARQETNQELRLEAVRQLSVMKAPDELADLYARETSVDVKQQILRGMGIGGHADKLFQVAQVEKDPELRRTAIRSLGLIRKPELAGQLASLYGKETDPRVREAVIEALFIQGDAKTLVALAKQEKDPELKKALVRRLSVMNTDEAHAYMIELLK
jgi:TolA-binding protein